MATIDQCRLLDLTYRKYLRGRPVEVEDIWAVDRLCESGLLHVYFENGEPCATAKSQRSRRRKHRTVPSPPP